MVGNIKLPRPVSVDGNSGDRLYVVFAANDRCYVRRYMRNFAYADRFLAHVLRRENDRLRELGFSPDKCETVGFETTRVGNFFFNTVVYNTYQ